MDRNDLQDNGRLDLHQSLTAYIQSNFVEDLAFVYHNPLKYDTNIHYFYY